jgi:hypothetical protein
MSTKVIIRLKGGLTWNDYGRGEALILFKSVDALAGWHPRSGYFSSDVPGMKRGHRGFVIQSMGNRKASHRKGPPTLFFYKTWQGWKNAVWREYRVRPPACYTI